MIVVGGRDGKAVFYNANTLKVVHETNVNSGWSLLTACVTAYFKNLFN